MTRLFSEQDGLFRKDGEGTNATNSDINKQIWLMSNERQRHTSQESDMWWLYLIDGGK